MSIVLNDNIKINAGKPSEAKYLNPNTNVPYTGTTEVNTLVPISERHRGLTVLIGDSEYWYKDGVANIDLILKSNGGSGERIEKKFTQSGHTFSFGDIIEYSGNSFQKALAVTNRNAEVIGFVSQVPNANTFTVVMSGYISGISGLTLSASTTYYLSDVVAGGLTSVEPIDPNTISKPVLTTITTNDAIVFQYRGFLNTTGVTGGGGTMGLDPKESAHFATTGPLTGATYVPSGGTNMSGAFINAPSIVDGHTVSINDRILVKDQTDQKQNGLYYLISSNTWYRTVDQDGTPAAEVSVGNYVFITTGSTYAGTGWIIIGSGDTLTLNVDSIEWVQFNSVASYVEGSGINITGQIISADVENGLSFSNDKIVLGGALTGDTYINVSGNTLVLSGDSGTEIILQNWAAGDYTTKLSVADYEVSISSLSGLTNASTLQINASGFSFTGQNPVTNNRHKLFANDGTIFIEGVKPNNTVNTSFRISPNDTKFHDFRTGTTTVGIEYAGDYSVNFTPRSLVDKAYVTGLTTTYGVQTANNGLTKIGTNVYLGGSLTGDTTIDGISGTSALNLGGIGLQSTKLREVIISTLDGTQIFNDALSKTSTGNFLQVRYTPSGNSFQTQIVQTASYVTIFKRTDTTDNATVGTLLKLNKSNQTAASAIGNGARIVYEVEIATNNVYTDGSIDYVLNNATSGAVDARFDFKVNSGSNSAVKVFEVNRYGAAYAADYSANFTPRSLVDKAYVTGLTSTASKSSTTITGTSGGTTTFNVVHNKNTRDVIVQVYEVASPYGTVIVDVERVTVNDVDVKFAIAPSTGVEYRVVII